MLPSSNSINASQHRYDGTQPLHLGMRVRLDSPEHQQACADALTKCTTWHQMNYNVYLQKVEYDILQSIEKASFNSKNTDKFSGKRRRMLVSGEQKEHIVASQNTAQERNRLAASEFRKRDALYTDKLKKCVEDLEQKNELLRTAHMRLSSILSAHASVRLEGSVALVAVLDKEGGLVEIIDKQDSLGLFSFNAGAGEVICSNVRSEKFKAATPMIKGGPSEDASSHFFTTRISKISYETYQCRDTVIPLPSPVHGHHVRAYLYVCVVCCARSANSAIPMQPSSQMPTHVRQFPPSTTHDLR